MCYDDDLTESMRAYRQRLIPDEKSLEDSGLWAVALSFWNQFMFVNILFEVWNNFVNKDREMSCPSIDWMKYSILLVGKFDAFHKY